MIFQEEMCVDYRFEVPREKGEENTSMYIHPRIEIRLWSHFDHTQMENNYTSARIQLDDVVCMNLYTSMYICCLVKYLTYYGHPSKIQLTANIFFGVFAYVLFAVDQGWHRYRRRTHSARGHVALPLSKKLPVVQACAGGVFLVLGHILA